MKSTKILIEACLTVAQWIETGERRYDWRNAGCCNCGLLLQALLHKSGEEVLVATQKLR